MVQTSPPSRRTWMEEEHLVVARQCPWLSSVLTKLEDLIFPVSNRSFRLLFVLCANIFWWLHWGIDYFKHVKHEGLETPAPTDSTLTRTTSSSLPSTPWRMRVARCSKLTAPISKNSSSLVVRWRGKGLFSGIPH
jgi:hypothetical protein